MYSLIELFNKVNGGVPYITADNDVQYCTIRENDVLYIYLAPSNSELDWKHNFMFGKRPYKDMKIPYKVHRGFLKCWKTIEDIIIDIIHDITIRSIIIVGYSHGGALAMLCHECCWFHRPDIRKYIYGISFEGPRVYASFFVKKQLKERWKNFINFRNRNDIVTHVPPVLFGYTHVGRIIKIKHKDWYGCVKAHYPSHVRQALLEYDLNNNWIKLFE